MYNRQTVTKPEPEKVHGIEIEKLLAWRRRLVAWNADQTNLLSTREKEVLESLAEGKTRTAIAKELYVDLQTVRSHIRAIFKKLNVHTREDAVRVAREMFYLGY